MSKARDGVERLKTIDANLAAKAPLASPSFTGNATITAGNLVIATASKGLAVGGTTAPNTLDDYEEGTFTAVVTMGSGSATVNSSANTLYYTKIGNSCTIGGQFQISSVSNPSGAFKLTLPFTAGISLSVGTYRTYQVDTPNDGTSNIMYSDESVALFQWSRDGASSTNENATAGGYYMIGFTYFTT